MNSVKMAGNITGDIYFDQFLIKGQERLYLRLVLMSSKPVPVRGLRVTLWDEKAALYHPYLRKGSEILVNGKLSSRVYKDNLLHEIVAENLVIVRKVNPATAGQLNSPTDNTNLGLPTGLASLEGKVVRLTQLDSTTDNSKMNNSGYLLELAVNKKQAADNGDEQRVLVLVGSEPMVLAGGHLCVGAQVGLIGTPSPTGIQAGTERAEFLVEDIIYINSVNPRTPH